MKPEQYSSRVVAFIDILGFRTLVQRLSVEPNLHDKLHSALSQISKYKEMSLAERFAHKETETSVFSDSIVISSQKENLFLVLWNCICLQAHLLTLGILTRGGISYGQTYHKNDILYGEGMLRAYDLERKAAIYPRIVVDPDLVSEMSSGHIRVLLIQDVDGVWHTDPFAIGIKPPNSELLPEDGNNPHLVFLGTMETMIEEGLNSSNEVGQKAKWHWLKTQRDDALEFLRDHGETKVLYYMRP